MADIDTIRMYSNLQYIRTVCVSISVAANQEGERHPAEPTHICPNRLVCTLMAINTLLLDSLTKGIDGRHRGPAHPSQLEQRDALKPRAPAPLHPDLLVKSNSLLLL